MKRKLFLFGLLFCSYFLFCETINYKGQELQDNFTKLINKYELNNDSLEIVSQYNYFGSFETGTYYSNYEQSFLGDQRTITWNHYSENKEIDQKSIRVCSENERRLISYSMFQKIHDGSIQEEKANILINSPLSFSLTFNNYYNKGSQSFGTLIITVEAIKMTEKINKNSKSLLVYYKQKEFFNSKNSSFETIENIRDEYEFGKGLISTIGSYENHEQYTFSSKLVKQIPIVDFK